MSQLSAIEQARIHLNAMKGRLNDAHRQARDFQLRAEILTLEVSKLETLVDKLTKEHVQNKLSA